MENLRLRVDIRLVNKWDGKCGARMLIARPNFKQCKIFDEKLVAIEMQKTHIIMDKPVAVGMCILDISKLTMYSFLYDFLKPRYGDRLTVLYGDTDSFVMDIHTPDFYEDMRNNIEMYDTSDYPHPNEYGIPLKNKKVPGLFKDELNGEILLEFVGLRAKLYAIRSQGKNKSEEVIHALDKKSQPIIKEKFVIKKAKGVKKSVIENKITLDHYIQCIQQNCEIIETQFSIRSIKHQIYTIQQQKIALSPFDDKRYLVKPNCIDTLAWGHYNINELEKKKKKITHSFFFSLLTELVLHIFYTVLY